MKTLKSCPFCGNDAVQKREERSGINYWVVHCPKCFVSTLFYKSPELSVEI